MSRLRAPLAAGLCFLLGAMSPWAAQAAERPVPATPMTVAVYATALHHINPSLPSWQSHELARHLLVNAERWRISPNVLAAIVTVESAWHTHAVSYAGAVGLGQLMPGTAANLGVNPRDPIQNLAGAARYLSGLLTRFGTSPNRYKLAFAAYNAGPQAVERYGGIPPYYETQHYVVKVLSALRDLQHSIHLPRIQLTRLVAQGPDINYWLKDRSTTR